MNIRPARIALLTLPLALALAACGAGGESDASGGSTGGTDLVVAYANPVNTLDPQRADYAMTNSVISAVYDTLVSYDDKGALTGVLAETFALSPDATSVDVTLRSGATFHDGSPVTAADVKYSLDRYAKLGTGVAGLLGGYRATTVTDDTHLTIELDGSDAGFLSALSKAYVMEAKLVTANAGSDDGQAWLQTHDAGSGPYVETGSPVSGDIKITRSDKYWGFDPKRPTSFTFRRIDQGPTQLAELKAGNVDVALNLAAKDAAGLSGDLAAAYLEPAVQTYVVANMVSGPTTDIRVRKALQLAFDYQGDHAKILDGKGTIADGILPATLSCRVPDAPSHQDLAQAKALLAEAGQSKLSLSLSYQPTNAVQTQEATLFQSNLRDVGIDLALKPIAFADYLTLLGKRDTIPQLMLLNDQAQVPDAGTVLAKTYGSKATGTNKSGFSNPEVDTMLGKAQASGDATARCDLYKRVQERIAAEAVTVNLHSVVYPVGYRSDIAGVTVSPVVNPLAVAGLRVG